MNSNAKAMQHREYYNLDEDAKLPADFYDNLATTANPVSKFIHNGRYNFVYNKVKQLYKPGKSIVDFACGNCSWNKDKLPVTGIDSSKRVVEHAQKTGKVTRYYIADITKQTALIKNSVDISVITESLEHITKPQLALSELYRSLKKGGHIIVSVPYDTNLSLWKPLFAAYCLIRGDILGEKLYKNRCGHINNFSPKSLKELVEKSGFKTIEQSHFFYFTQFLIAQKV